MEPRLQEIKISDAELAPLEEQEEPVVVPVYGGVQVSQEARQVLSLPPKFALHPNIDLKLVETEIERGIWKARWEDRSERQREGREPTEEELEEELASKRVYDSTNKELDLSKIMVTKLPTNRRVIAPGPLTLFCL